MPGAHALGAAAVHQPVDFHHKTSIILCVFTGAKSLSILACRFSCCNASMWRVAIVSACALLCHDAAAGTLPLPLECTCHVSTCARRQSQLVYNVGVTLLRSLRGSALGVGAGFVLFAGLPGRGAQTRGLQSPPILTCLQL